MKDPRVVCNLCNWKGLESELEIKKLKDPELNEYFPEKKKWSFFENKEIVESVTDEEFIHKTYHCPNCDSEDIRDESFNPYDEDDNPEDDDWNWII